MANLLNFNQNFGSSLCTGRHAGSLIPFFAAISQRRTLSLTLEQLTKKCGRSRLVGNTHRSLKTVLRGHKSAESAVARM